jgi:DNA processing protein
VLPADAGDFPAGLRDLPDCPAAVYVAGGDLPPVARAIAIVGSRAASPYGVAQARRIAGDLARLGYVIVSGLARGIDAAAHGGALEAGGRTVAVIASGLDAITPRHHVDLAAAIGRRGALLSEQESGAPPGRGSFVHRNRLIAALAAATVVVEAAERSGALTTAAFAARQRRAVLAVPGDVDRETARGCHALIRGGAQLCECAADVLEAIGTTVHPGAATPGRSPRSSRAAILPAAETDTPESRMLAVLGSRPLTVDALAAASGLPLADALAALLALQWAGAAAPHPGQRWGRTS